MTGNGHMDARKLHSRLNHPVIDADGHWLEYGPVMREEFRRIGGEAAVEALALASQRVPNSLKMTDIGHFDVPDMTGVVPEAYELVEHGLMTDDDFRDFMFGNAVRFWGEVNPDFFKGTSVEKAAAEVLAQPAVRA
ncbi:MAG: hypothetical protein ACRDH5_16065 [bacterium]